MEEDIKRIEYLIKSLNEVPLPYDVYMSIGDKIALENLIKGYRELEYKYNKTLTDLSIETKRTNEENYRCSLFAVENNDLKEKLADSIPKSKIKEKIECKIEEIFEEMEECNIYDEEDNEEKRQLSDMIVLLKEVLQELMEDK